MVSDMSTGTTTYRLTTASGDVMASIKDKAEAERAKAIYEAQGYGPLTIVPHTLQRDNRW